MNEAHEYYTQLAGLQELIENRRPDLDPGSDGFN